jgi:thiamine-phosphate diphosphorylase
VDYGLYLVTDRPLCLGRSLLDVARAAVAGGVRVVQLREKHAPTREFVELGRALLALLAPLGVPLIINDRLDVALAIGAQGAHLGQDDMPVAQARAMLGPKAILGLSLETMDQLRAAEALPAGLVDYYGLSPIFQTPTKTDAGPGWGLAGLARARAEVDAGSGRAIVAIGGIGPHNAASVLRCGAQGLAVVSAICSAPDPEAASRELAGLVRGARGEKTDTKHGGSRMDGYAIRRMARPELDFAIALAAAEGWNPGLRDAEAFWAADPDGFFLGLLDGRPAATVSAVRYDSGGGGGFGFMGFFVVRPELRGQGLGLRLWRTAQAALQARGAAVIGLDAVLGQVETYRKSGFEPARISSRYQGRAGGEMPQGLLPLSGGSFDEVLAYDSRCFPARREAFLRSWLDLPGHVALGTLRGGALAGFGVLRPCGVGAKIGPLFADDVAVARDLLRGLLASAPEGPVFFDAPATNPAAARLAEDHGMRVVFQTGRMYLGGVPEYDLGREFGVASFELG